MNCLQRACFSFLSLALATNSFAQETPGRILDLRSWRLTLPIEDERRPDVPQEVNQPELDGFTEEGIFFTREGGVVFRAHCGGVTTKGSNYPRCELREMVAGGRKPQRAGWATTDTMPHRLEMRVSITHTPSEKPHVVCAQIHDAEDDLIMVRLEGKKLFVEHESDRIAWLERNYRLGTPFDLGIEASNGEVQISYNEQVVLTWSKEAAGCYFKAGCYTQSNPEKGDDSTDYGEVVIYELDIE